ncbi:MAG: energy-coupling factor ABC transporter permease [Sphingomonadaceae bacterium]
MSHMHIPDGVMPLWIVATGWALTAGLLAVAVRTLQRPTAERRLPLLGVMSALMLVGMSVEIVPIGYHLNLTVITGILLGPALGFIAAFLVNLVLALIGHGGITVAGLNTIVSGVEVLLGYYLFRGLRTLWGDGPGIRWEAGITTLIALITGSLLMIGIVGISNVNPAVAAPESGAVDPGTLSFRNPFGAGVLRVEALERPETAQSRTELATFATLVLGLGLPGWVIESLVTGFLVGYLALVRPDLVEGPPHSETGRRS